MKTRTLSSIASFLILVVSACTDEVDETTLRDAELNELLERIEDPLSYEDEAHARALVADLELLSHEDTELLADMIVERHGGDDSEFRGKTAQIPVIWSAWPTGKLASGSGVTTQCGGDQDVWLRFTNVPNAYASPGSLRFYTNSIYVWGAMWAHDYKLKAFDITLANRVDVCIGAAGFNGPAIKGMLIAGLLLKG